MKTTKLSTAVSASLEDASGKRIGLPAQQFSHINDKPTWGELEELREDSAKAIVTMAVNIDGLIKATRSELSAEKEVELSALIMTFNDDSNKIIAELNSIHEAHKNKKGEIRKEKDIIKAFDIGLEYQAVGDLIKNSLNPIAIQITSICASVASMDDSLKAAQDMIESVRDKNKEATLLAIEKNKEKIEKDIDEIHNAVVVEPNNPEA